MKDRRRFLGHLLGHLLGWLALAAAPAQANSIAIHECLRSATTQAERDRCRRLPRGSGDK